MEINFTPIKKRDLLFLNEVRNSFAEEYLHDSRKFTVPETVAWWETTNPDYWIIWYKEQRIGYFRLSNYSKSNRNAYIGADIHRDFHGKGLGYLSYVKFIPKIFGIRDLNKLSLEVLATNVRAIRLYEKLGFVKEGVKREEVRKGDIYVDSIIMSLLYSEWKR